MMVVVVENRPITLGGGLGRARLPSRARHFQSCACQSCRSYDIEQGLIVQALLWSYHEMLSELNYVGITKQRQPRQ
eukprot:733743-Pyramimonas_sp.AAC.1